MADTEIPDRLFKFSTAQTLRHFLSNLCVRFTPPAALNDPFEFALLSDSNPLDLVSDKTAFSVNNEKMRAALRSGYEKTDHLKQKLSFEEYLKFLEKNPAILQRYAETYQTALDVQVPRFWEEYRLRNGVFSATAQSDNVLMWSYYGDYHKGFRLELQPSVAFMTAGGQALPAVKVRYQDCPPQALGDRMPNPALYKHTFWQNEDEWRFVRDVERDPPNHVIGEAWLYAVNAAAVKSITFGVLFDEAAKIDLIRQIRSILPDTAVLQACKVPGAFALRSEPII